ncbi:MAG: transporter substrate-binding domain-containing protein, partial [Bacteroidetes bacterium]|nr:transporter substrate-binding domain-containing protein [Bacteroidota bacterium]
MKIISKSLCFFLFIVAINIECYSQKIVKDIQKRGELRVGMSGDQPPFAMLSREDQLIGYEVQLAELLAEAMGVELKIIEIPFSELLVSLQERKVDVVMSGMTITTERNMKVAFVGPYILSGKSILTKSSTLASVKNASDMNQTEVKLVALKGSTSESFVKKQIPNASLYVVANYNEAVS